MNSVTLGIDLGKRGFHVVGCDAAGACSVPRCCRRQMRLWLAQRRPRQQHLNPAIAASALLRGNGHHPASRASNRSTKYLSRVIGTSVLTHRLFCSRSACVCHVIERGSAIVLSR